MGCSEHSVPDTRLSAHCRCRNNDQAQQRDKTFSLRPVLSLAHEVLFVGAQGDVAASQAPGNVEADVVQDAFRMWRWLSASDARRRRSRHGSVGRRAEDAAPRRGHRPRARGHRGPPRPSGVEFHTNPGHFAHAASSPTWRAGRYADQSTNWSGQIATGLTLHRRDREAGWCPSIQCRRSTAGTSATWIGIDGGPASPQLHHSDRARRSRPQDGVTLYYGLVRALPGSRRSTLGAVSPGDQMSASITQISSGSTGRSRSQDVSLGGTTSTRTAHL